MSAMGISAQLADVNHIHFILNYCIPITILFAKYFIIKYHSVSYLISIKYSMSTINWTVLYYTLP